MGGSNVKINYYGEIDFFNEFDIFVKSFCRPNKRGDYDFIDDRSLTNGLTQCSICNNEFI